jgi:hypothetical protein
MKNWVEIHREVPNPADRDDWELYFQQVTYHYEDGRPSEAGYRFIWRRDDGTLQAARGQARIPDAATLRRLIDTAQSEGWLT